MPPVLDGAVDSAVLASVRVGDIFWGRGLSTQMVSLFPPSPLEVRLVVISGGPLFLVCRVPAILSPAM
jgi:hypothetical protein